MAKTRLDREPMQYSSRFTIATHILLAIYAFSGQQKVTSEFLAGSVKTNPVIIRKILGMLQKGALVEVRPGTGGAFLHRLPGVTNGKRIATHPYVQANVKNGIATGKTSEIDGNLFTAQDEKNIGEILPDLIARLK